MSLSTVLDEKVKTSPCSPWPMMGGTPGCRLMTEEHDGSFTHTSMFLCHSRLWSGHCPSVSRVCVLHMPLVWPHLQHPSVRNLHAPFKWTIFYTASLEAGTFPLNCNLFVKAHMWRLVYVCVYFYFIYSVSEIFVMLKNEAFANQMLFRWQCMLEQNLTTLFLVNCIRLD